MSESVSWSGKRITIVGAGVSGRELGLLAARLGAKVFVTEKKELSSEVRRLFEEHGIAWEAGGHTERAFDADFMSTVYERPFEVAQAEKMEDVLVTRTPKAKVFLSLIFPSTVRVASAV